MPLLVRHYQKNDSVPELFALGFAAYIYFMKAVSKKEDKYFGEFNGEPYWIQDEQTESFYKKWAGLSIVSLVQDVLRDVPFWGVDLHSLPGFKQAVVDKLNLIINNGIREAIESIPVKKVVAA